VGEIAAITDLILQTSQALEEAVTAHWPVIYAERNGLQESNLIIHLAARALRSGLHAYPEASNHNVVKGHSRVDLLIRGNLAGIDVAVLVEAKKLFSAGKAAEMHRDYLKMIDFAHAPPISSDELNQLPRAEFGVLLAITADINNREWWNEPYPYDGKSWDGLGDVLQTACARGSFEITGLYPQYILFAIFRL
jgi:hypothetical protein